MSEKSHQASRKNAPLGAQADAFARRPAQPHVCVQRHANGATVADGAQPAVLDVLRSAGRPLDPVTRTEMETQLGYDFSSVRVHDEQAAARTANLLGAHAFTVGNHVAFGEGGYAPATAAGRRVMLHELTHVVQQAAGPVAGRPAGEGLSISDPADAFEREAVRSASAGPASTGASADGLRALPRRAFDPHHLAVQRADWGKIGGVAGIVGAVIAGVALIAAVAAWARPKNPAGTAAGVSFQPNPFSFNTTDKPAAEPNTPAARANFAARSTAAPDVKKILDLRTDDDNHTAFNLAINSTGQNVISATLASETERGYLGGYNSSGAAVSFSSIQTSPAGALPNIFTGPGPGAATPPATAASTEVAEVLVRFVGANVKEREPAQAFAGSVKVDGRGQTSNAQVAVTNNIGDAHPSSDGTYAVVDYRTPTRPSRASGSSGSGLDLTPTEPEHTDPIDDIKRALPFGRPMT
ncbi:MAG TPA: DUF4157 domain-containing protein [Candidatus Elarobacter sp.]|nr:DUF4157 domain-containing protein [Candidatus Elarobacter sp.]